MKKILNTIIASFIPVFVFAQNQDAMYSGAFLEIPLGVRAAGMGTAFTSIASDGSAFFWNPAGSSLTKGILISSQYSSQFGTISDPLSSYFFTGYSQNIEDLGAFSFNWIRLSIDNISNFEKLTSPDKAAEFAKNGSLFNNSQDAFYLNFSKQFNPVFNFGWQFFKIPFKIPVGINLKYIRNSFGGNVNQTGSGFGVDAGVMVITDMNDYFSIKDWGIVSFGFNLKDITNTIITWSKDNKQFSIPRSYSWGLSYSQPLKSLNTEVLVSYQSVNRYIHEDDLGMEMTYDKKYAFRIGSYNSLLTLGAGLILYEGINIDYSFQIHELGNPHRIGLSVNLDTIKW